MWVKSMLCINDEQVSVVHGQAILVLVLSGNRFQSTKYDKGNCPEASCIGWYFCAIVPGGGCYAYFNTSSVRSKSSITGRRNLQINKLAAYPVCSIFNHQLSAMLIPLIRFVVFSFLSIVLLSCASTRQPANDTAADRMGNESVRN